MKRTLSLLTLGALCALGLAAADGCTDPGCIRNSECGEGYECKRSACVATSPADAGKADASADAATNTDAGKPKADAGKK